MVSLRDVEAPILPLSRFRPLIGEERHGALLAAGDRMRTLLEGNVVWNVNSTASGGGVAEMLQVLVGYIRGTGIDARWVVLEGDSAFFATTKRIHNRIHGMPGDGGALGREEVAHYTEVTAANGIALRRRLRAGDVVLLHDPQTAGMAPALAEAGVTVLWRCHIGLDQPNPWTDEAWEFLRPHLVGIDRFVFSRRSYAPAWVPEERLTVIAPSIDPFSPKNQDIPSSQVAHFLTRMGVAAGSDGEGVSFTRRDGSRCELVQQATVISEGGPLSPRADLVVQVSRWDRLKDMQGVMAGFAARVVGRVDAHLALVGPSVEGVADDPEGATVLNDCVAAWEALPIDARRRVRLITLPMDDVDQNAVMVNALQRAATVIVQKSLAEGFGLTVAEGMWKAKPIVASRVGGITDQVTEGTGILLDVPDDLDAFGDALAGLLERPDEVARLGDRARRHILEQFMGDRHLLQYADLIERLLT